MIDSCGTVHVLTHTLREHAASKQEWKMLTHRHIDAEQDGINCPPLVKNEVNCPWDQLS